MTHLDDPVAFVSGGVDQGRFTVWDIAGHEGLSRLFRFDVRIAKSDQGLLTPVELAKLRESPCALQLGFDDEGKEVVIYGIVHSLDICATTDGDGRGIPTYVVRVVPTVSLLAHGRLCRVFQSTAGGVSTHIVDVTKTIFKEHWLAALDFRAAPSAVRRREFMFQFQESNWDFIQRWLQHEGLYYWFEHVESQGPDGEGQKLLTDKLIISDGSWGAGGPEAHDPPTLHYTESSLSKDSRINEWQVHDCRTPRRAAVLGYDCGHAAQERGAKVETPLGAAFRADPANPNSNDLPRGDLFGTDFEFRTGQLAPEGGHDYLQAATVAAQRQGCASHFYSGTTNCRSLRPGSRFVLSGAPNCSPNDDNTTYLVTAVLVDYHPKQSSPIYRARIEAIRAEDTYRPPQRIPWPRVAGLLSAHVCTRGDESVTTPPIDEHGRYTVQLSCDLGGLYDGEHVIQKDATTDRPKRARVPLRLGQPSTGAGFGTHLPPRPGTEVLLGHVDGDPDSPVIVATVSNDTTPSPVTTQNATQSVVKTYSEVTIEGEDLQGTPS